MKKTVAALVFSSFLVGLTACESSEKAENKFQTKERTQELNKKEQNTTESTQENTESTQENTESAKGNRSNPISFNETAVVNDIIGHFNGKKAEKYDTKIELSILEVIRGEHAYEILRQENEFNKPAPEGKEWVLVKVKGKIIDSETQDYQYLLSDMKFNLISDKGQVYNNVLSAVTPNKLHQKLYKGAEGEGYISQVVNVGDDFMIQYTTHTQSKIFFKSK
ncbi:hypothetical protein [Bacillus cereus]|uniref:Lipoprotein n=1 Tax=Bacillus cereus TaxID=1396 RepID=A0A9X7G5F4_BACCE|nr:hypothetical protein [Bacillus cereus]PED43146.1 hypothetical protein CON26_15885 [Bacillus cereus]PFV02859.1 hypothetical protein COK98_25890 [Bacillus cereus]